MPKRASESYGSQVATEDVIMVATETERGQGIGSSETIQAEVVKLLAAILHQVRNEAAVLRPPQLTAAAQEAIRQYGILGGAMSPPPSSLLAYVEG
jgi:hypothetical protein